MKSPHILLVEDEPALREIMAEILLDEGFSVEQAENGLAALALARAQPPDLVVSDITMPKLDGFGLLRELRSEPRTSRIPVIFLSGVVGMLHGDLDLGVAPQDVFAKPVDFGSLVSRVRALLDQAA